MHFRLDELQFLRIVIIFPAMCLHAHKAQASFINITELKNFETFG